MSTSAAALHARTTERAVTLSTASVVSACEDSRERNARQVRAACTYTTFLLSTYAVTVVLNYLSYLVSVMVGVRVIIFGWISAGLGL